SVAKRVGAVIRYDVQRIDAVAEGLRHFHMLHVADGAMEVNGVEGRGVHERVTSHDHARNPEEQNLRRRYEVIGWIERGKRRRALVGPAEGGDREEPGREPAVEDVFILANVATTLRARRDIDATHDLTIAFVAVP